MAKKVAVSKLNARTIDILNTIRTTASANYQSQVPEISTEQEVVKVGDILMGYPALANEFLGALMNRIALVSIKSSMFNNKYKELKKGYIENGETIEEVFVELAKAREFNVDKAMAREFARTLPDVRTAFHSLNWKVQYPLSIEFETLRQAFTSADGVTEMIARLTATLTQSAEYDEFLLFKYLIIKGVTSGKMKPLSAGDISNLKNVASKFKKASNDLTFMSTQYNTEHVHTVTEKADQYLFMTSELDAKYDIEVLANAFNMDKATFSGHQFIIDDFTTFDNDRFDVIRANSSMIEEVTAEELDMMADVCAVLVDKEWFQIYDNLTVMTETQVNSGLYVNYNLDVWKTVSISPFSNAIAFVTEGTSIVAPNTLTAKVSAIDESDYATVYTIEPQIDDTFLGDVQFVPTADQTSKAIAVHRYGAYIVPASDESASFTPELKLAGSDYVGGAIVKATVKVGDTVTFTKQ